MTNKTFLLAKLMSVLTIGAISFSVYAQEDNLADAIIDEFDIYSEILSDPSQAIESNSFTENSFNMRPSATGITFVYLIPANYSFHAIYWNGKTAANAAGCDVASPRHGLHVFRDGILFDSTAVYYNYWQSAISDGFPATEYCGQARISWITTPPPGRYTLKFYSGNQYVQEKDLFTVPAAPPPPPPPPNPCANTVPLYAAVNWGSTDFYMTLDSNYMSYLGPMGFINAGIIGKVATNWTGDTDPFRRHYSHPTTSHFYTISESESITAQQYGWGYENVEGHLFNKQVTGTVPLYRFRFQSGQDVMYYYSTNQGLIAPGNGWRLEGIFGYVCPLQ